MIYISLNTLNRIILCFNSGYAYQARQGELIKKLQTFQFQLNSLGNVVFSLIFQL